jgi:hypothetical protein
MSANSDLGYRLDYERLKNDKILTIMESKTCLRLNEKGL